MTASGSSEDDDELEDRPAEFARIVQENSRPWQGYWYWRDKPTMERSAAREVLRQAGFDVSELRSRAAGEDPPDCEAIIEGRRCGVEVTELVHRPTLERSLKALKARTAGKEPERSEAHFAWERKDLVEELQRIIDRKDRPESIKGSPYDRYFLVIVSAEMFLDRDTVEQFLGGAAFRAAMITDVIVGLDYHPRLEPGGGSCPIFRLKVEPRR